MPQIARVPLGSKEVTKVRRGLIKVRLTERSDLPHIASLHKRAYPGYHPSTLLSLRQLCSLYEQVTKSNTYCYTALDEGDTVCGFAVGGYSRGIAMRRFLTMNIVGLTKVGIKHPITGARILLSRLRPGKFRSAVQTRLLSIVVDPGYQSAGVGSALLVEFETQLTLDSVRAYGLSVRSKNASAFSFYESRGFRLECETRDTRYYVRHLELGTKQSHRQSSAPFIGET